MSPPPPPDRIISSCRAVGLALLIIAGLACTAATAVARTAIVRTDDGNLFRGELIQQNSDVIILRVEGIDMTLDRENLIDIVLEDTPDEIYAKRRGELAETDLAGRLALAQEMRELDALRLAESELNDLDRDFPERPAVLEELAIVDAKLRLLETQAAAADSLASPPQRSERRGETETDRFLTPQQINLIKVYEINLDDESRVEIPKDTMDSFFQKYADHPLVPIDRRERSAFRRLDGHQQLDVLFRVQARDLYDQVEVKNEPATLSKFRRSVNPRYVARYFAPTFGHGQIEGLSLFNQRPETEAEAYTNFYRLTQFRVEGQPLIDRASPEMSLLLQWGLVRESARYPAPDIDGWEPMFRSTDDSDFRRYVDWIDSLFKDDLDYGFAPPTEESE